MALFRVIEEENEIHRQRIKSVNPKLSTVVEFLPEEMNLSVIEKSFGCLVDNDINVLTEIRFQVMKQYTTNQGIMVTRLYNFLQVLVPCFQLFFSFFGTLHPFLNCLAIYNQPVYH
jgi:hypothetical protein